MTNALKVGLVMFITGLMGVISIAFGVLSVVFIESAVALCSQYSLEYILSFQACRVIQDVSMALAIIIAAYATWKYISKPIGRWILKGGN